MTLKDRSKKMDDEEKLWYEQAFGDKKNLMRVRFEFAPEGNLKEFEYVCELKYHMFPEMDDEFNREDWPTTT